MIDQLDSRIKSDVTSLNPVVKIVNPETQLEKGTDYTLTVAPGPAGDKHNYLTVTMTPDGLASWPRPVPPALVRPRCR